MLYHTGNACQRVRIYVSYILKTMKTYIFTDGASKGNPGPGGWGAVIMSEELIQELGGGEEETTNNRMELTAAIQALDSLVDTGDVTLFSDSSYLINGITKWVFGWEKNDWKTKTKVDVLNKDLWQELREKTTGKRIDWRYVPGHSDVAGNERANDIAEEYARGKTPELFMGSASDYSLKLLENGEPLDREGRLGRLIKSTESKKRKTGVAHSYVSLLDGKIEIHKTWDECKRRVNGKPARFKKAMSKADEERIVAEFKK